MDFLIFDGDGLLCDPFVVLAGDGVAMGRRGIYSCRAELIAELLLL
jgi:hypothetical protein